MRCSAGLPCEPGNYRSVISNMIVDMTHRKLDPDTVARLTEESLRTPPVAAARMLEGHMNVDWCDMLPTIDVPVLIGAGDHDPPAAAADAAAALIPRATVMGFAHSGHCPFIKEPEEFNRALETFLHAIG